MDDTGWVLWAGTVGLEGGVPARFDAAVAAGCRRVSLSPLDVGRWEDSGGSALELAEQARERGLDLILDPVMNWYPGPIARSRFSAFTIDDAMRMARELGVVSMTVLAHREGQAAVSEMAAPFAEVCDRAGEFGAAVHVEFIPMTQVPDLRFAWELVATADRDNGGVLFDTWHFFRGDPDLAAIDEMPGERILAVQVDDAHAQPLPSLWDDTRERLLPGDGDLDLVGALRRLDRIGGLRWVGPEVISTDLAARAEADAAGVARVAVDRVRRIMEEARV